MRNLKSDIMYQGRIKKFVKNGKYARFLIDRVVDERGTTYSHLWVTRFGGTRYHQSSCVQKMFDAMRQKKIIHFKGNPKLYSRQDGSRDMELVVTKIMS